MSCVHVVLRERLCTNVNAQTGLAAVRSAFEPGYNLIDGDYDGQFPSGERQV